MHFKETVNRSEHLKIGVMCEKNRISYDNIVENMWKTCKKNPIPKAQKDSNELRNSAKKSITWKSFELCGAQDSVYESTEKNRNSIFDPKINEPLKTWIFKGKCYLKPFQTDCR